MADYGVLKEVLEGAGAIVNAGVAIAGLILGRVGFEPPVAKRAAIVRILSILCGVGACLLWALGRAQVDTLTLEWIAAGSAVSALVALIAYAAAWLALCLSCLDDPRTFYLRGLWMKPSARAVLAGDLNQPPPYGPVNVRPANPRAYLCNSGRDPAFLWGQWSLTFSGMLMVVLFAWLLLSASTALTSVVMVSRGPTVRVEARNGETLVDLPSDVLFAFDKADLLPGARAELDRTAQILRARSVRSATIAGYTDGKGSHAHNLVLSERRAAAVWEWLRANGDIENVSFHVVGKGSSDPRAPNIRPDGTDNPEGRALNRRVEVIFAS